MSLATGARSALAFKEEVTFGTAPSGNWEEMSFNSESLQENINTIVSNEVKSDRTVGNVRGGNIMAGGNIGFDLYSSKAGIFFKHLLCPTSSDSTITPSALSAIAVTRGTYVTSNSKIYLALNDGTVTSGDVSTGLTHTSGDVTLGAVTWQYVAASATTIYQHLLTGNKDLPTGGLSFEKRIMGSGANQYFPMVGGRVNEINLNIPTEGIVTADLALLAQRSIAASASSIAGTPTTTGDEPFVGLQADLRVNSVVNTVAQSATLRITNNLDGNAFVIGNRFRKDVPTGQRQITGTITMFFEDLTTYDLFKQETKVPIKFSFAHNGNYMEFDMPECKLTGGTPTPAIAGNGTITHTFNFNAFKNTGAYDIRMTLKNQVSTY